MEPEHVQRRRFPPLGVDVITLKTPRQIATALASGDLKRVQVHKGAKLPLR